MILNGLVDYATVTGTEQAFFGENSGEGRKTGGSNSPEVFVH